MAAGSLTVPVQVSDNGVISAISWCRSRRNPPRSSCSAADLMLRPPTPTDAAVSPLLPSTRRPVVLLGNLVRLVRRCVILSQVWWFSEGATGRDRAPTDGALGGYTSRAMETYKCETQAVIHRFLHRELSFPECVAALDAALADFMPIMSGGHIARVRVLMLANNEM